MNILLNYNEQEIWLLSYLLTINVFSFILFSIDKRKAKNSKWRISEKLLLFVSFLGGSTGSLIAVVTLKHKLSKRKFYLGLPFLILLHRVLIVAIFSMIK